MSQFWQHLHSRLQPAVAMEKARLPGRKWKNGFFSMGSTCTAQGCPHTRVTYSPSRFSRTPQKPRSRSSTLQCLGHSSHSMRLSAELLPEARRERRAACCRRGRGRGEQRPRRGGQGAAAAGEEEIHVATARSDLHVDDLDAGALGRRRARACWRWRGRSAHSPTLASDGRSRCLRSSSRMPSPTVSTATRSVAKSKQVRDLGRARLVARAVVHHRPERVHDDQPLLVADRRDGVDLGDVRVALVEMHLVGVVDAAEVVLERAGHAPPACAA